MIWPIAAGLMAGAFWALTFIAPGLVAPFGPIDLTVARYAVFGLSSGVVLIFLGRDQWLPTLWRHWLVILGLALTGNTIYYLCLSEALLRSGTLLPTMIIGTLPVVMALLGGVRNGTFSLRRFVLPAWLILGGILSHILPATWAEASEPVVATSPAGLVLALVALASWAFYGVRNAEFLAHEKQTNIVAWTALTGIATLVTLVPVAALLPGGQLSLWHGSIGGAGPLLLWGTALGLLSSWAATWLWNIASRSLPAEVLGYLIVSETVFAILYAFVLEQRLPTTAEIVSVVLLIGGVSLGIRAASNASRLSARGSGPAARAP
ncbi:DMT family transporter [Methylobacterium sp. J-072]|uniref:DMT family transporter n=1 Tax=Methylobacterium sp. J-072 TaxID=2836651 RepID=UPI001FBA90DC|nr:DMT family transporter [Methylobacterium sp. J-072]MCJ2092182.1 DMT family transporter [Methylobacterium sp. J-072]